jgi:hypothetical protein
MKIFLTILVFTASFNSFATLPKWVKDKCELGSYEMLTSPMYKGPFYKIIGINSKIILQNEKEAVETKISFDDSDGCLEREVISTCIPENSDTIMILSTLTDCLK